MFTDPTPKQEVLDNYYSIQSEIVLTGAAVENYSDESSLASEDHWVVKDLPKITKGVLLEIGPGNGSLMRKMRELGWNCWGVDPGQYITDAQIVASLEALPAHIAFDVIVCQDVIEHVSNVVDYISKVCNFAKSGSFFYFSAPYSQSLEARLLKGRWEMVKPFGHLHYFSKQSICHILEQANLEILNCYILNISAKKTVLLKRAIRQLASLPIQFKHRAVIQHPYQEQMFHIFKNIVGTLSKGDQIYAKAIFLPKNILSDRN
jgi:2-polyprenyl-3-methyl-5-hydroxy-6-metoxy-1,4-benzoquinol methylase